MVVYVDLRQTKPTCPFRHCSCEPSVVTMTCFSSQTMLLRPRVAAIPPSSPYFPRKPRFFIQQLP